MAHQRHELFLGLLSFLLLLAHPTETSRAGEALVMHKIDEAIARKTRERINTYSVLKSHDVKLSEGSLWNVTESVVEESAKHSLDPMLVLAVMKVESRFDHRAVSSQGALGLMQIRPIVVDELVDEGKIPEWKSKANLRDPILNIKIGVAYLSYLKKMFNHMPFALAAYNSGPTRIRIKLDAKEKIPLGYANKVAAEQLSFKKHTAAA